jgi:hypothetical protein
MDFVRARTDDLVYRTVDETVIMLDLRTQHYLSLNRSGAELWPLIARGARRDELVDELRDRYGLSDDDAVRDVEGLIDQLATAGLLDPGGGGDSDGGGGGATDQA